MANKTDYLERIYVASPCTARWESMSGTEQVRHCAECNRNVYDLSKLTRGQAEKLIVASGGRLCAGITRRPDGTVINAEEPCGLHLIPRRASPIAAAVVSAVIGAGSAGPALASKPGRQAQVASVSGGKDQSASQSGAPANKIVPEPAETQTLDVQVPSAELCPASC